MEGADGPNRRGHENEAAREDKRDSRPADCGVESKAGAPDYNGAAGSARAEQTLSTNPGFTHCAHPAKNRARCAAESTKNGTSGAIAARKNGTSTATGVNAGSPKNPIPGYFGARAGSSKNRT